MRKPTIANLYSMDPAQALVGLPQFPVVWNQPAASALLALADSIVVQVACTPFVGCAMAADIHGNQRTILTRVAPATEHLRTDTRVTYASIAATSPVDLDVTFASDGVEIRTEAALRFGDWPVSTAYQTALIYTSSSAIVPTPVAGINRQANLVASIQSSTESATIEAGSGVTVWAGALVEDLETL